MGTGIIEAQIGDSAVLEQSQEHEPLIRLGALPKVSEVL